MQIMSCRNQIFEMSFQRPVFTLLVYLLRSSVVNHGNVIQFTFQQQRLHGPLWDSFTLHATQCSL